MFIILCIISPSAFCQVNNDSLSNIFEAFKRNIQKDFDQFKSKNDSIFINFLRQSWEEYDLFFSERPSQPKPDKQPSFLDDHEKLIKLNSIHTIEVKVDPPIKEDIIKKDDPIVSRTSITEDKILIHLEFYGTNTEFSIPDDELPTLSEISNIGIADFYENASNSEAFKSLLQNAIFYKNRLNLNGWGYLRLCEQMSMKLYSDFNQKTLATWYLLAKSSQKAKVAYSGNKIYLLCGFNSTAYNMSYCEIEGEPYYLYAGIELAGNPETFYTYKINHVAQTENIILNLYVTPEFEMTPAFKNVNYRDEAFEIILNKNLINFLSDYPDCSLEITLNAPLSDEAWKYIDLFIKKRLIGMQEKDKLDFLLDFVQQAFPYQNDIEQFGREDYLFAEETLNYPYCDCEDRVALMAQMLERYTPLKCIGLNYPGHVSLAVKTSEEDIGYYIKYNYENYYICDPTYIGAKCGMIMPKYKNIDPEIITIN